MAVSRQTAQTNTALRNGFRVGGILLLAAGLVVFIHYGARVLDGIDSGSDMNSPDFAEGPSFGSVLATMGGFLMIGLGLQLLYLGFLRTAVNYVAGEGSEAIHSVSEDLAGGIHDGWVGRDSAPATAGNATTGPFCSTCGVRNDAGARFCDACGTALS